MPMVTSAVLRLTQARARTKNEGSCRSMSNLGRKVNNAVVKRCSEPHVVCRLCRVKTGVFVCMLFAAFADCLIQWAWMHPVCMHFRLQISKCACDDRLQVHLLFWHMLTIVSPWRCCCAQFLSSVSNSGSSVNLSTHYLAHSTMMCECPMVM